MNRAWRETVPRQNAEIARPALILSLKPGLPGVFKPRNPQNESDEGLSLSYKDLDFNERRDAAATAKKALLDKFKARPPADDPSVVARQDERRRVLEAREIREREREIARQERLAREAIERAERERIAEEERLANEEAARLEAERLEAEERDRLALELATDAEKKAKRDARYAARKARSGKRW